MISKAQPQARRKETHGRTKKLDMSEYIRYLRLEDNNQFSLGRYKQEIKNMALHLLLLG